MTRRFGFARFAWCFTVLMVLARLSLAADDMDWPDESAPTSRPARPRPRAAPRRPAQRPAPQAPQKRSPPTALKSADAVQPAAKPASPPSKLAPKTNKAAAAKDAAKSKSGADDDDDDDDDEEVESVEAAPAPGAPAGKDGITVGATSDSGWTISKLWAHMHAAMIHLPIAWLLAWSGCEALALVWPHPWLVTSGLPLGLATALGFAPSVYSGLMRLEELAGGQSGYDSAPALLHRNLNLLAWTFVVIALALRLFHAPRRSGRLRLLYLFFVFSSFVITAYSAHLGGVLVYGDEFFPF